MPNRPNPAGTETPGFNADAQGVWTWDVRRDRVYGDRVVADLAGLMPDLAEAGLPLARHMDAIHPADRTRVREAIESTIAKRALYREIFRVTGNGWTRLVLASGRCYFGEDGEPLLYSGVVTDLSRVHSLTTEALGRIENLLARTQEIASREVVQYMVDLALEEVRALAEQVGGGAGKPAAD